MNDVNRLLEKPCYIIDFLPKQVSADSHETFGYNMTKYNGFLLGNREHYECIIEIYHDGDRVFVEV